MFVAPFAWLLSASFQAIGDMFSWPTQWIPENPTLNGYKKFLGIGPQREESPQAWRWFLNSAFVAVSVTVLQLFFNSLAAYVFAKRQFPGRDAIFLLFLATMMIPSQITLIPNYLVIKHIPLFGGNDILGQGGSGWLDSYWADHARDRQRLRHLPARQYMTSIPDELLDAARIDGANEFSIYARVVTRGPRGEALLPYLQDWDSDLILRTTRAYLQVPGEGFDVPSGVLQGERAPLNFVDWERNGDPDRYARSHLAPVPVDGRPEWGAREWVFHGSPKFSGQRVTVAPGRSAQIVEAGVYSVFAWSGTGTWGGSGLVGGEPGRDELLVSFTAATAGVDVVNAGRGPFVAYLLYGPDLHPEAASIGGRG